MSSCTNVVEDDQKCLISRGESSSVNLKRLLIYEFTGRSFEFPPSTARIMHTGFALGASQWPISTARLRAHMQISMWLRILRQAPTGILITFGLLATLGCGGGPSSSGTQ